MGFADLILATHHIVKSAIFNVAWVVPRHGKGVLVVKKGRSNTRASHGARRVSTIRKIFLNILSKAVARLKADTTAFDPQRRLRAQREGFNESELTNAW